MNKLQDSLQATPFPCSLCFATAVKELQNSKDCRQQRFPIVLLFDLCKTIHITLTGLLQLFYKWEARSKVGGKKKEISRKNLYFEGILVIFQQKWGGSCLPCPPGSNSPGDNTNSIYMNSHNSAFLLSRYIDFTRFHESRAINMAFSNQWLVIESLIFQSPISRVLENIEYALFHLQVMNHSP